VAQQSFQYFYLVSDPAQSNFTVTSLAGSAGYTVSYVGATITPAGATAGNDGGLTATTYSGYTYSNGIIVHGTAPGGSPAYYLFTDAVLSTGASSSQTTAISSLDITTLCFLEGTHLSTPEGEVLVENLRIGDQVSCADGAPRAIIWIGRQSRTASFCADESLPIEIGISALGENLPQRPLRVSPGHSLLIHGAFPIASALVNGTTVRQLTRDEMPESFVYYHIETEDHAMVFAEGVVAETFVDAMSRRQFSNWLEYVELYGDEERRIPESEHHLQRVLRFDDLPQSLKAILNEPCDSDTGKRAA
jgi:hypothetical protein